MVDVAEVGHVDADVVEAACFEARTDVAFGGHDACLSLSLSLSDLSLALSDFSLAFALTDLSLALALTDLSLALALTGGVSWYTANAACESAEDHHRGRLHPHGITIPRSLTRSA
jgi:hypothetical protein